MALTRRGRLVVGILATAAAVTATTLVLTRGPHIEIPDDPCRHPPAMQTFRGVTLQPLAMTAYKEALRLAGRPIEVRQSYRSCAAQAAACERICRNPQGCPDTCARPGTSYHQLGAAIDVTETALRTPGVVTALEKAGWCESVPRSDPGHFSFGGCH